MTSVAQVVQAQDEQQTVTLNVNSSKHFKLGTNIARIYAGSSKIVRVDRLPPALDEFIVTSTGEKGVSTLFVWLIDGSKHEYTIEVSSDEEKRLSEAIEAAIGLPDVHVKKVEDRILLTGTVKNQYERNYAIQVARLYVKTGSKSSLNFGSNVDPQLHTQSSKVDSSNTKSTDLTNTDKVQDEGNVIDLLQMSEATQIRLEAQVIAINSEDAKDLGILYGNNSPSSNPGIFYFRDLRSTEHSFQNNPFRWLMERRSAINFEINALITNNKAKILSRPSVMTLSGEQATIQIGGEIPYPVRDSEGRITITFKNYGIILQFKPIVDSQSNIVSTIYTEVSNISGEYVDDWPILANRRADSVVSLKSGSTMVIGGLMDSSERKVLNKIPLLGDIPIIGEFFKYSSKTKDKQELIILVTPYIIDENNTGRTKMSEEMSDYYRKSKQATNELEDVDANE